MINASDKTEPAAPSPPPSSYRARYFLDFCFRSNSDMPPPKSPALVNLCHSPLHCDSPGCILRDDSFFERYRYRKEYLFLSLSCPLAPLRLRFSWIMRFARTYQCQNRRWTERKVSRIYLVRRLNSGIDESDEMGDSVINHAAGARVPRVADATSPPACTVQRHESTLKPRQHPSYGSTEPLRPTPLSPLRLPARGLTSWIPVTHWYSREVFRNPPTKPCEKCELNKESLRESDHFSNK